MRDGNVNMNPPLFFSWKMAGGVTPPFFFVVLEHGGGLPGSGGLPDPPDRPTADREEVVRYPHPRSQRPSCLISLIYIIKQTPDGKRWKNVFINMKYFQVLDQGTGA